MIRRDLVTFAALVAMVALNSVDAGIDGVNLRTTANDNDDLFNLPNYHYVPLPHNWMNDPNGPFYDPIHKLYHLMFQYKTPRLWGHAVSKDLIHWKQLPVALDTDEWYDKGGVFSGSATLLDDAAQTPVLSYSVSTNDMQALAFPKNRSDPYLVEWVKFDKNPIISSKTGAPDGRDDTTAWKSKDGKVWRMAYGLDYNDGKCGAAVVYDSKDFLEWTRHDEGSYLHTNCATGMWECPDFFPIPGAAGSKVTHFFKASTAGQEFWVTGTYDDDAVKFIPFDSSKDMGTADQKLDHGKFYASKTFYDPVKDRQILWGWGLEERQVNDDGSPYGWASFMTMPRTITMDADGVRIVTQPIEEMLTLRDASSHAHVEGTVTENSPVSLPAAQGDQLEIAATVTIPPTGSINCGVATRVDHTVGEKTLVTVVRSENTQDIAVCTDTTSSSKKESGASICTPPLRAGDGLDVKLRVYVDHSVLEVFVNDGYYALTRRMYPTSASATASSMVSVAGTCKVSVDSWKITSAPVEA